MKTGLLSKMLHPGATKATTPHFVMRCNSNGEKTLNSVDWKQYKIGGK